MAVGMVYEFWNRASLEESGAGSQCTLWCSVLSGFESSTAVTVALTCLDAPHGARCFLSEHESADERCAQRVLMHLMELGAF